MKILNLLENLVSTSTRDGNFNGNFKSIYKTKPNELGSGKFSNARLDKTDPHMVRKSSNHPMYDIEGFNVFARYIAEPGKGRMDNIHMPKVYTIATLDDNSGRHIDTYRIEKLHKLQTLTGRELVHIFQTCFDTESDSFKRVAKQFCTDVDIPESQILYHKNQYDNLRFLANILALLDIDDITFLSDTMKEAISIVNGAVKHGQQISIDTVGHDYHLNNFMYRRTPSGCQLVFSDPICIE